MADLKISALTPATTPLGGTEVLPVVQSGSTVKVAVSNLTSGRTVDMSIGLVNTTTARANVLGSITNSFQVEGTAGNNSSGQMVRNSANANGPSFYLGKSRSATVNGNTVVVSGDTLGRIDFLGADGTNLVRAASMYATVDGTPGTNDMPGRLAFLTSPDGTVSPVERLTIDNAGVVTVSSDNVVMNTAGKGINFTANTNAPGMTSELLNWYEEGTWTPTVTAVSGAYTTVQFQTGRYTRMGRMVHIVWTFTVTSKGTGASAYRVADLPFAINQTGLTAYTGSGYNNSTAVAHTIYASGSGTTIDVYRYDGTDPVVVNQGMVGSCTYFV
jgi:hypothetical protein